MREDITTNTLNKILLSVDDRSSLDSYLEKLDRSAHFDTFIDYFRSLDKVKSLSDAELQKRSGIDRTYCYHILNGSKIPGRDKIIRLCLAAGLDITQTRRALEVGKVQIFYPKRRRDAVICFAIQNHMSVMDTNLLLDEYQMELLK